MAIQLPKYLTTEYASTPAGTVALHANQFIIHTQHPRFIAVIEKSKLIPVDFCGHTYATAEIQAALDDCAAKFGQEFAGLMDEMLGDANGPISAVRLAEGFSLKGLADFGSIPYRSNRERKRE